METRPGRMAIAAASDRMMNICSLSNQTPNNAFTNASASLSSVRRCRPVFLCTMSRNPGDAEDAIFAWRGFCFGLAWWKSAHRDYADYTSLAMDIHNVSKVL